MNELVENDLRDFYTALDDSYDAIPALDRLRAQARHPSRRRNRLWAAVAASGTALAGGIATAILILSSGASVAYAGWTPVPTTPTPAALSAAIAQCKQAAGHVLDPAVRTAVAQSNADNCDGQPVLTDARGKYVALIYAEDGQVNELITAGDGGGSSTGEPLPAAPGADELSSPSLAGAAGAGPDSRGNRLERRQQEIANLEELKSELAGYAGSPSQLVLHKFRFAGLSERVQGDTDAEAIVAVQARIALMMKQDPQLAPNQGLGPDPFGDAYGRAGSDVSAVTFTFSNGKTVEATIENGWYFAWWPWAGFPTSAQVTTSSGTATSPMPGQQCTQQPGSCVFVGEPQD